MTKLNDDYDPTNHRQAIETLQSHKAQDKLLTGLIYIDPESENFHEMLNISKTPFNELNEDTLCPGSNGLKQINEGLK